MTKRLAYIIYPILTAIIIFSGCASNKLNNRLENISTKTQKSIETKLKKSQIEKLPEITKKGSTNYFPNPDSLLISNNYPSRTDKEKTREEILNYLDLKWALMFSSLDFYKTKNWKVGINYNLIKLEDVINKQDKNPRSPLDEIGIGIRFKF